MILTSLYHWSPRDRRKQIRHHGLKPGSRPCIGTITTVTDGKPMICLGSTPMTAWSLSGKMRYAPTGWWDLWEVTLRDNDEVYILPIYGARLKEVRVANRIPKLRVIWIGEREKAVA